MVGSEVVALNIVNDDCILTSLSMSIIIPCQLQSRMEYYRNQALDRLRSIFLTRRPIMHNFRFRSVEKCSSMAGDGVYNNDSHSLGNHVDDESLQSIRFEVL